MREELGEGGVSSLVQEGERERVREWVSAHDLLASKCWGETRVMSKMPNGRVL